MRSVVESVCQVTSLVWRAGPGGSYTSFTIYGCRHMDRVVIGGRVVIGDISDTGLLIHDIKQEMLR